MTDEMIDASVLLVPYIATKDPKRLLAEIRDNAKTPENRTAVGRGMLIMALRCCDWTAAEFLVTSDSSILASPEADYNVLQEVLMYCGDRPDIVEWLVKHDVNIHHRTINNWTSLHIAARLGHVGSLCKLIDCGADLECGTVIDGDLTPLMEAAIAGQIWCCLALIAKGANLRRTAEDGNSACDFAKRNGHLELGELLTLAGECK